MLAGECLKNCENNAGSFTDDLVDVLEALSRGDIQRIERYAKCHNNDDLFRTAKNITDVISNQYWRISSSESSEQSSIALMITSYEILSSTVT